MSAARIVEVLAELHRGPDSKIAVTLNEAENGTRYVSVARLRCKDGEWLYVRGVALQFEELRQVAAELVRAAEEAERPPPTFWEIVNGALP